MKVIVDAGHGGIDPGAQGNGIIEKDYNLKISKYIYDRLKSLGVNTDMTRSDDTTLSPSERISKIKALGDVKGNLLVSNHLNAGGGDGAEVIYALRNNPTFAKTISEEIGKEGQNVRDYYQRRLPGDSSKDYYFLMRDTANLEPVIIEYGFLDSKLDDVSQIKNNYQSLAEATVRAICTYLKIPYTPPTGSNTYVVQKGDTLYGIASKYGVSVNDLKAFNNLTTNDITAGVILRIPDSSNVPSENSNYITYTVKSGDSLYSIAKKYNTTVDAIKKYNALTSNTLSVGQRILIETPTNSIGNTEYTTYQVLLGDSLYSIANRYGISVDDIIKFNNLTSNVLSVGQTLLIPSKAVVDNGDSLLATYTVKSGDSLYSIATKYNTTVDNVKSINGLTSNLLSVGQVLLLPTKPFDSGYITYTVKSGDSLYSIATKHNTTVDKIKDINNLTSNLLTIGEEIKIPV